METGQREEVPGGINPHAVFILLPVVLDMPCYASGGFQIIHFFITRKKRQKKKKTGWSGL